MAATRGKAAMPQLTAAIAGIQAVIAAAQPTLIGAAMAHMALAPNPAAAVRSTATVPATTLPAPKPALFTAAVQTCKRFLVPIAAVAHHHPAAHVAKAVPGLRQNHEAATPNHALIADG